MTDRLQRFTATNVAESTSLTRALGGELHPVGDGVLVLMGPGFFVNRAMGLGLGATRWSEATATEIVDEIERRSTAIGVPSRIEVCAETDPTLQHVLDRRGYRRADAVSAMACQITPAEVAELERTVSCRDLRIREVSGRAIDAWKATAARGFGYTESAQRTVSDAFVDAADRVPEIRLLVASLDGVDVATASFSIHGDTAQVGGMTTDPAHRRRGVQHALLVHRLRMAVDAGCDLVVSSAAVASQSERNLGRVGFESVTVLHYADAAAD